MEVKVLNTESLKSVELNSGTIFEALNEGDRLIFPEEVIAEEVTQEINGEDRTWVRIYDKDGRNVSVNALARHYNKHGERNELQRTLKDAKNAFDVVEAVKGRELLVDKVTKGTYQGNDTKQIRFDYAK